eukprot:scaffold25.g5092.t1
MSELVSSGSACPGLPDLPDDALACVAALLTPCERLSLAATRRDLLARSSGWWGSVEAELGGEASLQELELTGQRLAPHQLEAALAHTQLTRLVLVQCALRDLPADLPACSALLELDVSDNPLLQAGAWASRVAVLPRLASLRLAGCGLTALPSALAALGGRLRELDVSKNEGLAGWEALAALTALERLAARRCGVADPLALEWHAEAAARMAHVMEGPVPIRPGMTALPPEVAALRRLRELDVSHNPMRCAVWRPLSVLTALSRLDLSETFPCTVPSAADTPALRDLGLRGVMCSYGDQRTRLAGMGLTRLDLSESGFLEGSCVPELLSTLTALRSLDITKSRFQDPEFRMTVSCRRDGWQHVAALTGLTELRLAYGWEWPRGLQAPCPLTLAVPAPAGWVAGGEELGDDGECSSSDGTSDDD